MCPVDLWSGPMKGKETTRCSHSSSWPSSWDGMPGSVSSQPPTNPFPSVMSRPITFRAGLSGSAGNRRLITMPLEAHTRRLSRSAPARSSLSLKAAAKGTPISTETSRPRPVSTSSRPSSSNTTSFGASRLKPFRPRTVIVHPFPSDTTAYVGPHGDGFGPPTGAWEPSDCLSKS